MRRRVLWLIKGLGPGGAERLLVSFAGAADHASFDYHAAYLVAGKDQLVPELEARGVAVHHLAGPWWPARLRRLVRDQRFDVVHVHSPAVAAVARPVLRTTRPRPAIVTTEHNTRASYTLLTRWLNDATYGLDDVHLAVSDAARRSVRRRWRDRVEVVVHGVPVDAVATLRGERDSVRAELGAAPGDVVVGTVANHRREKDYPTLLRAARAVLDAEPSTRFVAVGQGPLTAEIEAECRRLGLGEGFRLLGYRPDAARVMAGCDVFTLSSLQEGQPVAVMEALALGLPVVASAVGGVSEAIRPEQEGILVPPRRPDLLSAALLRVVRDDGLRAAVGAAAAARSRHFDIRPAVARTEQIYANLTR